MKRREHRESPDDGLHRDPVFVLAQAVFFLKVTLLVVAFDPYAEDSFGLVKSALSHASSLVLLGLLVWLVLRRGRSVFPLSPVHIGVAAVVMSFLLATPLALDQTTALFGTTRRYLGLTHVLDSALTYAAAFMLFFDGRGRARFLAAAIGAAIFADAYSLVQRAGLDPIKYAEASTVRPIATIGNADTAGAYLAMVAIVAYVAVIESWQRLTMWARLGLGALALISAFLAISTETRIGFLVLFVGVPIPALLLILRRRVGRRAMLGALAVAAGLAVVLVLAPSVSRGRVTDLLTDSKATASRLDIYATSLRLVATRPILGLGPDNFAVGYPAARSELSALMSPELENSTHDWPLYLATSAGLVGLAAGLMLVVLVLATGVRSAIRDTSVNVALVAVVLYLLQGLTNPTDVGLDWILWSAAGVIAAAEVKRGRPRPLMDTTSSTVLGVLLLVALAIGGATQLARIEGSEQFSNLKAFAQQNRGLEAVNYGRAALQIDNRRGIFWSAFGTALVAAGNPSAAENAFIEAAIREPWVPLHWRNIGIVRLQQGKTEKGVEALQRALQADPFDPPSHGLLARISYVRGDYERAAQEGELQARYASADVDAYETPYRAFVQLGRLADAERLLVEGLRHLDSAHLHVLLAKVYAETGRRPAAMTELARALAAEPTSAEALALRDQLNQ